MSSNNDPGNGGDMHEGFEFRGEELDARPGGLDEKRAQDGVMAGANVWPQASDCPGFRESVLGY